MIAGSSSPSASGTRAAHRSAWLVLVAISVSIAIYTVIGLFVVSSRGPAQEPPQLRIPFYVAALFLALGSVMFRRTQLRWMKLQAVAGARGRTGLVKYLFSVTIISVAMAEVVALLGLLLVLLGGTQRDVLTLGGVALLVSLSCYPRRAAWEQTVDYLFPDKGVTF